MTYMHGKPPTKYYEVRISTNGGKTWQARGRFDSAEKARVSADDWLHKYGSGGEYRIIDNDGNFIRGKSAKKQGGKTYVFYKN